MAEGLTRKEFANRLDATTNKPPNILVLFCTNQDALQALFGDNVTTCFGKRVVLDPTLMQVARRELVLIRLHAVQATGAARRLSG